MCLDEIRRELDEITAPGTDWSTWLSKIEDLRRRRPHTVRQVEPQTNRRFNCFMYALRLEDSAAHHLISRLSPSIFADACFVRFLERRHLLVEKDPSTRQDGDILVYEHREMPHHAGRCTEGQRVTSKWGGGPMFEHDILEVPTSYGNPNRCFLPVERATMESYFIEYARCMGHGTSDMR